VGHEIPEPVEVGHASQWCIEDIGPTHPAVVRVELRNDIDLYLGVPMLDELTRQAVRIWRQQVPPTFINSAPVSDSSSVSADHRLA
jgi:hypothetical protein